MKKKIKKILIFILIILIAYIIFREIKLPSVFKDEFYIIDFENTDKILSDKDEQALITCLNSNIYTIQESDKIEITKIAYQYPFRHESTCYIFFNADINAKLPFDLINITSDNKQYVSKHICMNTNTCEEFKLVRKIVNNNYKWWENNEKKITYTLIEEPYYTGETDNNYYENYEVVSGKHLSGKIIDITDKYLKIQKENMEIKLVEIDWKSTNFVNYRTKESLTLYNIKCGDYFLNNQIVRNINGQELIRENLKNIIETSSIILFVPTKIISITNMNDYYIVKIEMEDSTSEYFGKTRENRDKYEIDFIINNDTKFYPEGKDISITTLQYISENYMITLYINEESIENKYPIISKIDVYDI